MLVKAKELARELDYRWSDLSFDAKARLIELVNQQLSRVALENIAKRIWTTGFT